MSRRLRIHTCSWNVAQEMATENLESWLGLSSDNDSNPAVIAVGLQEVNNDSFWDEKFLKTLSVRGFVRIKERRLKWLVLYVFVQHCHLPETTNIESEVTRTGFGGLIPNKGGVSIRLDLYGVNLIFVNCHLEAHLPRINQRIADYDDIIENQHFRDPDVDNILDHDFVFWIGDTNFRIDDLEKTEIEKNVKNGDLKSMWSHDQLLKCKKNDLIFVDFEEGPLTFNPTYKYDIGTDDYDTSEKQRKPAWTDRILWMVHEDAFENITVDVNQLSYEAHPEYISSDHKPISAKFDITVMKFGPPLPVTFLPMELRYKAGYSIEVRYHISGDLNVSSWDWLALYRENFQTFDNYESWEYGTVSSKKTDNVAVKFGASYTGKLSGKFLVGYFCRSKNCVVGYSNVFEITDVGQGGQ